MSGLPSSFEGDEDFYNENRLQKFFRHLKEEPLIPIGCAATCYALYQAYQSIKIRDGYRANQMFRWRIYCQAFTVVSIVAGSFYYNADRILRRDFEVLKEQQKAQEKREAWIRELEARDLEDRQMEARNERLKRQGTERENEGTDGKIVKAVKEMTSGGSIVEAVKEMNEKDPNKQDLNTKDMNILPTRSKEADEERLAEKLEK